MVVGRLATQLATVLMGKHKPEYTPHVDTGDYVIVLNADKVRFTGGEMVHPCSRALYDQDVEEELCVVHRLAQRSAAHQGAGSVD